MTSVESKVLKGYHAMNATEKKIADYYLQNAEKVFRLPIQQLAEEAGVSQAAWVRFAKFLGFSGLKELKHSLFAENAEEPSDAQAFTDIKDFADISSLLRAIKANSTQAIEDTYQLLEPDALAEIARRMITAGAIRLFGIGASATVAEDFFTKLMRVGMKVFFHFDAHMQLSYAANAGPNDVALFISHSGATREVLETHGIAKAAGAFTVSLTRFEKNPLASRADLALYTRTPEVTYRSGAMSSRLAQLFVVDMLYTVLANQHYEQIITRLQKSSESCRTHRVLDQ